MVEALYADSLGREYEKLPWRRWRPIRGCPLTQREIEVLKLACLTSKAIAIRLGISEQTVKNHLIKILVKLAVYNRAAAILLALKKGWLDIGKVVIEARPGEEFGREYCQWKTGY